MSAEARHVEDIWCLEEDKRTQWTVTEAELGLFIELAVQGLFVWHYADLHFAERDTSKKFSWHPSWFLLMLTCAEGEAWLSLTGSTTAIDLCLLYPDYWNGLLVYQGSVWSRSSCHCWILCTELKISWESRWEFLQKYISKEVQLPHILFSPLLLVGGGLMRCKVFKNHH